MSTFVLTNLQTFWWYLRDTGGIARDEEKLYFRIDQVLIHNYASPQTIFLFFYFFANISRLEIYQALWIQFLLIILSLFLQITSSDTAETAASSKVLNSKIHYWTLDLISLTANFCFASVVDTICCGWLKLYSIFVVYKILNWYFWFATKNLAFFPYICINLKIPLSWISRHFFTSPASLCYQTVSIYMFLPCSTNIFWQQK